ncbi:MAG: Dihydropteroate synthase [Bacteroidota bacterium]
MILNLENKKLDFSSPKIMGILNITPDSFFAGSRKQTRDDILSQANKMLSEGADILDIGGHSTRPDAKKVSNQEEINRVGPAIEWILEEFPECIISVDTYRQDVAEYSIKIGAKIVNDIGFGNMDENMIPWIGENNIPYILSHSRGSFDQVHQVPNYKNITEDVIEDFQEKMQILAKFNHENLILDPGFGFSKNIDHNYEIVDNFEKIIEIGLPVLVGVSRKSMIYKKLGIRPEDSLPATIELHKILLRKGAHILRVHDVKEAKELLNDDH